MTSSSRTTSSAASGTSSRGSRSRRSQLSPAHREATDAARAATIAALHDQISERVEQLTADPQWRAMLDAAAKFHTYSLNNQLLIELQAARLGINPTRVAGFGTWKALGRSVLKGSTGIAVLALCTYTPKDTRADTGTGQDTDRAAPAAATAATGAGAAEPAGVDADRPAGARVLRGFRVAHVFDISQTEGDPLPDITPELLTGDAPAALWDALATQVAAHGYTLTREACGQANGLTDPAARTVRVRPDVADAQAVKTLAHELAHIECGHTADGYDYTGCLGRAEAEAESVAYIVTAWAGLDAGAYTVPYVAAWSAGDTDVVRAAAGTLTAAARRILDHLDGPESTENTPGDGEPPRPPDRSRSPGAPASSPPPERGERDMTATSTPGASTPTESTPTESTPTESTATESTATESTATESTATESTATLQSIEGEPAMTTASTVAALNTGRESTPDEPFATGNAHSAEIEQRETEHVDPADTGRRRADTGEDSGRSHQLVWLDPRELAVHPRNIRDDLGDLSGLADSIAAQGVLEALTVIPHADADGTPGHQIIAGHRRAAASILAGVAPVPCVLRPDLALDGAAADGDRAAQAGHVGAMLAENLHRQGLSAVEEARGVQAMLDLGVPLSRVAKSTGLGRKRVAKAAGVARLDGDTAAAVAGAGLTLDQAAAVGGYADDPDTTAALIAAAGEGPGQFAHALTRAKQARAETEQAAALLAELTAAGRTVLDEDTGRAATRLADLEHDGRPLTADGHAGCPGAAVYVRTTGWQGPQPVEVCTDPVGNGHRARWTATALPAGAAAEERSAAEREGAAAERRATIDNNKAMAAANETRREWVKGLLQRKTAPKAALRFAVETMAADPRAVSRWLSGQPNRAQDSAAADLGIDAPGQWWTTRDTPALTLTSGAQVPDTRLAVALLAHVAGAIESGLHRQSWRNPSAGDARWLRFLAAAGYTLADIEQQIVDTAASVGPAGGDAHEEQEERP